MKKGAGTSSKKAGGTPPTSNAVIEVLFSRAPKVVVTTEITQELMDHYAERNYSLAKKDIHKAWDQDNFCHRLMLIFRAK